ncbi:MAG: tyrosine-type recombinase/integrase [Pseudomonadota bacterium]|nr:tyrosine-type recombinase/integrase [Pseudomonadota bacterium]
MKQKPIQRFHSLYDDDGQRKYLTLDERQAFAEVANQEEGIALTFCGMLLHTGCRISEALALTADRVDLKQKKIVIESLKKRRNGVYRSVPVPDIFLKELDLVHGVRAAQAAKARGRRQRLWPWSRTTAWRLIKRVLREAGIDGGQCATAKGLRHGFAKGPRRRAALARVLRGCWFRLRAPRTVAAGTRIRTT